MALSHSWPSKATTALHSASEDLRYSQKQQVVQVLRKEVADGFSARPQIRANTLI
jgi:hypothetical protein